MAQPAHQQLKHKAGANCTKRHTQQHSLGVQRDDPSCGSLPATALARRGDLLCGGQAPATHVGHGMLRELLLQLELHAPSSPRVDRCSGHWLHDHCRAGSQTWRMGYWYRHRAHSTHPQDKGRRPRRTTHRGTPDRAAARRCARMTAEHMHHMLLVVYTLFRAPGHTCAAPRQPTTNPRPSQGYPHIGQGPSQPRTPLPDHAQQGTQFTTSPRHKGASASAR
jgi:hypothetical protein